MSTVQIELPPKLIPVLTGPARYRGAHGGRGCIAGDTLLDTPDGLVRVDEFPGGVIWASDHYAGRVAVIAAKPIRFAPEMLYTVTFSDGSEIKTTAKHRFFTKQGWIETSKLSDQHDIFSFFQTTSFSPLEIHCSSAPSEWHEDARHCLRKLLGFLYGYSEYRRQCDPQLHTVPDTYLDVLRQLIDEPQHKNRISTHEDGQESAYINTLSPFLLHLSTLFARAGEAAQNCEGKGNHSGDISSELFSASRLAFRLSHGKTNHSESVQELAKLTLSFCTSKDLGENPQKAFDTLLGDVDDSSYSDCFAGCNHYHHSNTIKLVSVTPYGFQEFFDLFVPFFNNYMTANGVVHHNSGKSYSFALMAAIRGYAAPLRILCARELQRSIKDSVHAEIERAILAHPFLDAHYDVGETYIRGNNGTEFIFRGLRHNIREIKSMSGIGICWIEEAEAVSEQSWTDLIPTIRENGSEIWATWNPESLDSPVRRRFLLEPAPGTRVTEINWRDNPWFPSVLEADRQHMLATNPDLYPHVWEGECITRSDAQILKDKWIVEEFKPQPDWDGPYYGADWGFSVDPTVLVRCWIGDRRLWIEHESYAVGLELDETASRWRADVPECDKYVIRADSSLPQSISYVKRHGMPMLTGAEKWPGSVEDGIKFLRSFDKIVIHPRCEQTHQEARLYSYKVDRLTGDVTSIILDNHNHCWDSVRYALAPIIRNQYGPQSAPVPEPRATIRDAVGAQRQPGRVTRLKV